MRDHGPLVGRRKTGRRPLLPEEQTILARAGGFLEKTGRNRRRAAPAGRGSRHLGPRRARGISRRRPRCRTGRMFLAELLAGAAQEDRLPPLPRGQGVGELSHRLARTAQAVRWLAGRRGNCGQRFPCLPCLGRGRTGPPWTGRWSGTPGGMTGGSPVLRPWRERRMGMELRPMQYKGFVWPHNPRTYTITYDRQVAVHKVPFGRYAMQDLGMGHRVMRGRGVCGAGGLYTFRPWPRCFTKAGPGTLLHPVAERPGLLRGPGPDSGAPGRTMCGTPLPSGRPTAATGHPGPGGGLTRGAPLRPRAGRPPWGPDPYGAHPGGDPVGASPRPGGSP